MGFRGTRRLSVRSLFWNTSRLLYLRTPLRRFLLTAPPTSPTARDLAAFEQLVNDVDRGTGDELSYAADAPKHAFLRYLLENRPVLLHGTGDPTIAEFEPRRQTDYDGAWTDAVFATDDPIWPIFFAVVNREVARSLVNSCSRLNGQSHYYFSIGADPRTNEAWRTGWIYILPRATFRPHRVGSEWMSPLAVEPLARLRVEPSDFPFLADVVGHERGEPVRRIVLRATLLRGRGR
jgi:hypothetical protein